MAFSLRRSPATLPPQPPSRRTSPGTYEPFRLHKTARIALSRPSPSRTSRQRSPGSAIRSPQSPTRRQAIPAVRSSIRRASLSPTSRCLSQETCSHWALGAQAAAGTTATGAASTTEHAGRPGRLLQREPNRPREPRLQRGLRRALAAQRPQPRRRHRIGRKHSQQKTGQGIPCPRGDCDSDPCGSLHRADPFQGARTAACFDCPAGVAGLDAEALLSGAAPGHS